MKTSFAAALLGATIIALPAFAQTGPSTMPAAPPPIASGPPVVAGAPLPPLTSRDHAFVGAQLESSMAEMQAANLALQNSQDKLVRDYAQKMLTDHAASDQTLMALAQAYHVQAPTALTPGHQAMLTRLKSLHGHAFDRAYINDMIAAHDTAIHQLDQQVIHGQNQQINVWVQNTRPVMLQHDTLAQSIKSDLPRAG